MLTNAAVDKVYAMWLLPVILLLTLKFSTQQQIEILNKMESINYLHSDVVQFSVRCISDCKKAGHLMAFIYIQYYNEHKLLLKRMLHGPLAQSEAIFNAKVSQRLVYFDSRKLDNPTDFFATKVVICACLTQEIYIHGCNQNETVELQLPLLHPSARKEKPSYTVGWELWLKKQLYIQYHQVCQMINDVKNLLLYPVVSSGNAEMGFIQKLHTLSLPEHVPLWVQKQIAKRTCFTITSKLYLLEPCKNDVCNVISHRLPDKFLSPTILLNRKGHLHFQLHDKDGSGEAFLTKEPVPLRQWINFTFTVDGNQAHLKIANGNQGGNQQYMQHTFKTVYYESESGFWSIGGYPGLDGFQGLICCITLYRTQCLVPLQISSVSTTKKQMYLEMSGCLGNIDSFYISSVHYYHGIGIPMFPLKAIQQQLYAAVYGDPLAQLSIGYKHQLGLGMGRSGHLAAGYFRAAAIAARKVIEGEDHSISTQSELIRLDEIDKVSDSRGPSSGLIEWLKKEAKFGSADAKRKLAEIVFHGEHGVNANKQEAIELYRQGAAQGEPSALYNLGVLHLKGVEVPKNETFAMTLFEAAARKNFTMAYGSLGYYELIKRNNASGAIHFWKIATELGDRDSTFNLATQYETGVPRVLVQDKVLALQLFQKSANLGQLAACIKVADNLLNGDVLQIHVDDAIKYYRFVAEHLPGIGLFLKKGLDSYMAGKVNESLLSYLYAAETGLALAFFNGAFICDENPDVTLLHNCSLLMHSVAAELGWVTSIINIGDRHWYGEGVALDRTLAVSKYARAIEQIESPRALFNLGFIIENSYTIPDLNLKGITDSEISSGNMSLAALLYSRCKTSAEDNNSGFYPCTLALMKSRVRQLCVFLVKNFAFRAIVFISIIVSSCLAVLDRSDVIKVLDLTFDALFILELLVKIIAYGLVLNPYSYLRDPLNVLDATIITVGLAASIKYMIIGKADPDFTILRLVRIFRPIRLLVVAKELRVVLHTIIECSKALLHVAVFILLILTIFAIIGLELFSGKLHHVCYNVATGKMKNPLRVCRVENDTICGMGYQCIGKWHGPNHGLSSFDNIGYSYFSVFQIITLEDWTLIYYQLNDAMDSKWHSIYFVLLILLGSYFSLDLLVGVLTNQYMKTKDMVTTHKNAQRKSLSSLYSKFQGLLSLWKAVCSSKKKNFKAEDISLQNVSDNHCQLNKNGHYLDGKEILNDIEAHHQVSKATSTSQSVCSRVDKMIFKIVHSKIYFWFVLLLITVNAAVQVAFHKDTSKATGYYLDIASTAFTGVFAVEFILNIRGFGMQYLTRSFGVFDTVAILLSIIDVIYSKTYGRLNGGVSIVRSLSLIRAFKATKFWPRLSAMYSSFVKSFRTICSLLVVLLLTLFIYALLGYNLFRNVSTDAGDELSPIGSFKNIQDSMLMVFVLLTGEGWPTATANLLHNYGLDNKANRVVPLLFFVSFIVIGNFILLNIFLGIMIDNLTTEPAQENQAQEVMERNGWTLNSSKEAFTSSSTESHCDMSLVNQESSTDVAEVAVSTKNETQKNISVQPSSYSTLGTVHSGFYDPSGKKSDNLSTGQLSKDDNVFLPQHRSLFIFSTENKLRIAFFKIVTSTWFPKLCLISIIISTLLLAFEDPLKRNKKFSDALRYCDYVFTGLFTVEIVLKIIVYGLIFGHRSCFLRDKMNVTDTIIVVLSVTNIILDAVGIDVPLQLRVLRVLRVFRGLKISKDLQCVVNCLVTTLGKIFNYFLLYLLLLFIYAVIGVKMYAGKLKKCSTNIVVCNGLIETQSPDVFQDADYNFNNVLNAMMTLFSIGTLDNWVLDLQQLITQAKDIDRSISIFFILSFLVVMTFIMLNIFVGFVVMTFQTEKQKQEGFEVLDKRGQECISLALKINPIANGIQRSHLQQRMWKYLSSPYFEFSILFLVILNCVLMMTKHWKQEREFAALQQVSDIIFTVLFTIELLLRLLALSPAAFIKNNWCLLDVIVVIGSWIDVITMICSVDIYINISIFRIFRVIRICHIINKNDKLKQIMATFMKSMKSVPSVAFLILMILFIYAVLGMQLFGKVKIEEGGPVSRHAHFQDFPTALMVLLRTTTLDNWRELMIAFADTDSPNCVDDAARSCGSKLSYPFFISFVFISAFIITNLFLAVIMDNFVYLTLDPSLLYRHHIHEFARVWVEFDPDYTKTLHTSLLLPLLRKLPPPLGFGELCPKRIIYAKLLVMNLSVDEDDTVQYRDVLLRLVIRSLSITQ
eukprot:gene11437-12631_t